jgi:hypothetical protein
MALSKAFDTTKYLPVTLYSLRPHSLRPHSLRPHSLRSHSLRPHLPVTLYSLRPHTLVAVTKACDRSKESLTYLFASRTCSPANKRQSRKQTNDKAASKQTTKPQARADILLRLRILYIALVVLYLSYSRSSLSRSSLSGMPPLSPSLSLLYASCMPPLCRLQLVRQRGGDRGERGGRRDRGGERGGERGERGGRV